MHAKIMALMCPLNGFLWITHERERSLLTIKFSAKKNIFISCNLTDTFNIFITDDQNLNPPSPQFKINL